MKISTVTVCFNSGKTIARTVESFLAQTYPHKEMVVVDGLSRDDTLDVVRSYNAPEIRIHSEKDRGIFDAMNKGLRLYSGDAVGFLNSDDTYHDKTVLARIADGLVKADAVHGGVAMIKDHETKELVRSWRGEPFLRGSFRKGWMPPHPTFYLRRAVVEKTGEFDASYTISADYDFMLRALELHASSAEFIPGPLVDFLVGGNSSGSIGKVIRGNLECLRSRQKYLGAPFVDPALFLKPARKLFQRRFARSIVA